MKNNVNKNLESSNKKQKDSAKSQNSNILYKAYNNKKNNIKTNNNINSKELSDIKSIVKNSVEKIYDLFSLQKMKENSKIISRKSNELNQLKNSIINFGNLNNTTIKYNEDLKDKKNIMKTNITFKINNYLSVLNKNKQTVEEFNNGTITPLDDEITYLHKKYKKNEMQKISANNLSNVYNLKKNKNKELKKNNSSNYNYIKNKNDIRTNILMSSTKNKNSNILENDYLFYTKDFLPINFEDNKHNIFNEFTNLKSEETNNYINNKSIIVNTKYKKSDINKNNFIIKPTKISHINREEETITNDGRLNLSKDIKINKDSRNSYKNNSEKRKKYMFLRRSKTKNTADNNEDKKSKKLIFSQKKSKSKYNLSNSRVNSYKLYKTKDDAYLKKDHILIDNDYDMEFINNLENKYKKPETDLKKSKNNSKKSNLCINTKTDKLKNNNFILSNKKNNFNKKDLNINISRQNNYIQTSNKLVNINNLLISGSNNPKYLFQKCKSDHKLKLSTNNKNKSKDLNKSNSNLLLLLESDTKNSIFLRNKKRMSSSRIHNNNRKIKIKENKKLFNSSKKKLIKSERNNTRKALQKIYNTQFPSRTITNDIIKLFLLLNEYIINNNLLPDYNLGNNKDILNELSMFLSKYALVDYPKEFDINIDNYINRVKIIQRCWRKYKLKQLIGENEEIHELKKIVVNKYITKTGYKIKKILGLFNSIVEEFNNINNSDDINKMFYYIKNLIKRDLTSYEKNLLYKEFINNFIYLK